MQIENKKTMKTAIEFQPDSIFLRRAYVKMYQKENNLNLKQLAQILKRDTDIGGSSSLSSISMTLSGFISETNPKPLTRHFYEGLIKIRFNPQEAFCFSKDEVAAQIKKNENVTPGFLSISGVRRETTKELIHAQFLSTNQSEFTLTREMMQLIYDAL